MGLSGLNPFTCVAAQYPLPLASSSMLPTRLDARFSYELVANLSLGWVCTNWIDSMNFARHTHVRFVIRFIAFSGEGMAKKAGVNGWACFGASILFVEILNCETAS